MVTYLLEYKYTDNMGEKRGPFRYVSTKKLKVSNQILYKSRSHKTG